jgi:hypothetical protein
LIQAKTKDGNPIVMTIGPNGVNALEMSNPSGLSQPRTTGQATSDNNPASGPVKPAQHSPPSPSINQNFSGRVFNFAQTALCHRLHAWVTFVRCRDPDALRGDVLRCRFNEKDQYPVSAKSGAGITRNMPDKTTAKLAELHFYQLTWWTTTTHNSTFISAARKRTNLVEYPKGI